jgi:hypothetical protein
MAELIASRGEGLRRVVDVGKKRQHNEGLKAFVHASVRNERPLWSRSALS